MILARSVLPSLFILAIMLEIEPMSIIISP
jgi:hypothetical protein